MIVNGNRYEWIVRNVNNYSLSENDLGYKVHIYFNAFGVDEVYYKKGNWLVLITNYPKNLIICQLWIEGIVRNENHFTFKREYDSGTKNYSAYSISPLS